MAHSERPLTISARVFAEGAITVELQNMAALRGRKFFCLPKNGRPAQRSSQPVRRLGTRRAGAFDAIPHRWVVPIPDRTPSSNYCNPISVGSLKTSRDKPGTVIPRGRRLAVKSGIECR
jgi:hypothetical protein